MDEEPGPARQRVVLRGDVHVYDHVAWANAEYEIHGNLILHDGGELTIDNATVSLICRYAREFIYRWDGGRLVTRGVTLGGSQRDGIVYSTNFELQHGQWLAEDTIIQYSSGVTMGWTGRPIKLHATRLQAGPHPDSIIMSAGAADVVLTDSSFNISLAVSAHAGGTGRLDLPVREKITRVFDGSNLPGVQYRLELVNTQVDLWWVFFSGIRADGPPTEVVLGDCPRLIPSLIAHNLRGPLRLPAPWPAHPQDTAALTVGNLTLRTIGQPVRTWCWGLYFSGDDTDVSLVGPTHICELFLLGGKLLVEGDPDAYNSVHSCTTVDVGRRPALDGATDRDAASRTEHRPVELTMRHVALGRFDPHDTVIGQLTAYQDGRIRVEQARCARLKLITQGDGTIEFSEVDRQGQLESLAEGGVISVPP
ncbi:MAG: hypothetical protein MUF48_13310 [Pirellulaceae bacterium]|nr:hypothetical protein [Pirellulaceae bacterium]